MIMFDTQLVVVEQVIPKSRHFSGWISEQRIHTTGAALIAYPAIHIMVMPTESGEAAGCGAIVELHQAVAQHQSAQRHHAKADFQRWLAARFIHCEHRNKGGKHKGQAHHRVAIICCSVVVKPAILKIRGA